MIKIEYPSRDFRTKKEIAGEMIFDDLRRAWIRLTPEEWVRQNFIRYLVESKGYPASLIAVEKKIMLGELTKRFDILVYSKDHMPWMMIECKSMRTPLDPEVLHQVLRYNITVPVRYLVITNGTGCLAFGKSDKQLVPLDELPVYGND